MERDDLTMLMTMNTFDAEHVRNVIWGRDKETVFTKPNRTGKTHFIQSSGLADPFPGSGDVRYTIFRAGSTVGKTESIMQKSRINLGTISNAAAAGFAKMADAAAEAAQSVSRIASPKARVLIGDEVNPIDISTRLAPWHQPAVICKPLQFIRDRCAVHVTDPKTGLSRWEDGPDYRTARYAANRGDGATVKRIARRLASGNA